MIRKSKWKGRIVIILIITSFFTLINPKSTSILSTFAASGTYSEDFTSTTYMDNTETNVTGWGTGSIQNTRKKPEVVGSLSSALIGNTLDVFVDGNIAYVTNQEEGLKIVNITNPTNPYILSTYTTADIAQSVVVSGDYAFIADYQGDDYWINFQIVNVTNLAYPTLVGNCSTFDNARAVIVEGKYAFVANDNKGLSIIDVSNPKNPSQVRIRDTDGSSVNLAIQGNYIYLADGVNGLVIIDITNPLTPFVTAEFDSSITFATSVVVEGNYAYVIDLYNGMIVVNITDPTSPTSAGMFSISDVSDAYLYGNYLYVVDITNGLSTMNITDPSNPIFINTINLPGSTHAIDIEGSYAYLACSDGGFQVVKISDLSSPPILTGSYGSLDESWGVHVSGDYAYVADRGGDLRILDINDPSSPSFVGSYNTPASANGIFVSGDYAYVADWNSGLQIIDISDPSSPTYVGSYNTPDFAYSVVVSGDYAYVADRLSGMLVIDINDPSSPFLAGSFVTADRALDISVSGDYAYIADFTNGLKVVDISDPSSPSDVSSCLFSDFSWGVFVSGDHAYVAAGLGGLQVVDINIPSSPILVDTYVTLGDAHDVVVSGDYAYVADGGAGLKIVEVRKNRARQFDSLCIAQSNNVFSASTSSIKSATLVVNANTPTLTSISYSLSADGGSNWETITPELEHIFSNTGDQLKWKAVLTTTDVLASPIINNLSIDYTTQLIAPSLDMPIDGSITDDYTPTFTWSGINSETAYLFQLDTSTSFTAPLINITIPSSSTSYTPSLNLFPSTFYWRIAGIDSEDDMGVFSDYRTLYIIEDTNPPIIDHPVDIYYDEGDLGNSITWNPSDTNPYYFNITRNTTLLEHGVIWDGSSISIDIDGLSEGVYNFTCYVFDREDLFGWDSVIVTVEIPIISEFMYIPLQTIVLSIITLVVVISKKKIKSIKRK